MLCSPTIIENLLMECHAAAYRVYSHHAGLTKAFLYVATACPEGTAVWVDLIDLIRLCVCLIGWYSRCNFALGSDPQSDMSLLQRHRDTQTL